MYSVQCTIMYRIWCLVFGIWSYILDMWMRACLLFLICESLVFLCFTILLGCCCCYCVLLLFSLCFCSCTFLCEWHRWGVKSMIFLCIQWLVCGHFKPGNRLTMRGKINKCTHYAHCTSFVLVIYCKLLLDLQ